MNNQTRKLVMLAMMSAIAFLVVAVARIPVILFLKYEPKDVIITIAGFLYGPLSSFIISVVVSLIEMVTVSENGWIGLLMNVISSCAFACTAAWIYKRRQTLTGAVIGLVIGCLLTTAMMLLWNYLITPIYMSVSREKVVSMLMPVFLPFNLLKGGLNGVIIILLYKPLVKAMRSANLIPARSDSPDGSRINLGVMLVAMALLATLIVLTLVLAGVI